MSAIQVNGVKYISLLDDNNLKLISLNSWVYYTLRDVFWNADEYYCIKANDLNSLLVYKKKDTIEIKYTNILDNIEFVRKIYEFLNSLNETSFYFVVKKTFDKNQKYIEYKIWWKQLQELKNTLRDKLKTTKIDHQLG